MNDILVKQLALDFCCTEEEVRSRKNVFTQYVPRQGRRIFEEGECFLKVAAFRGKLLFTGKEEIISWAEPKCKDLDGSWFMEADTLRSFDQALSRFGCRIKQVHPFFIAHRKTRVDTLGFEIRRYVGEEIGQFRGDDRFGEAFLFADAPKDELGVAALAGGEIVGMAGASGDSDLMWQIGINVMPGWEGKGIGTMLTEILKNDVLERGKLPFYGTSVSHIASQTVAWKAGFCPAWAELYCEGLEEEHD